MKLYPQTDACQCGTFITRIKGLEELILGAEDKITTLEIRYVLRKSRNAVAAEVERIVLRVYRFCY